MKTLLKALFASTLLFTVSCGPDENTTEDGVVVIPELESTTYTLKTANQSGVAGTVRFTKNNNFTLSVKLDLTGTSTVDYHAAYLYYDDVVNNEENIALTLDLTDGGIGSSETVFTTLDDGTEITYEQLIMFDGHIEVKLNDVDLSIAVANADIGINELTGVETAYPLTEVDLPGISGDITFKERKSGNALAVFNLSGTPSGVMHPAHIHAGSLANAPGGTLFNFNMVDGTTGTSETNILGLEDGTAISYADIANIDGYINVNFNPDNLTNLIAQGNIGSN